MYRKMGTSRATLRVQWSEFLLLAPNPRRRISGPVFHRVLAFDGSTKRK